MDPKFKPRTVEELMAEANKLGHEGKALQKYVDNQQAIDLEREKREFDRDEKEKERVFELEKMRLQQGKNQAYDSSGNKKIDRLDKNFKSYIEGEDLVYFLRLFEATASKNGILKEDWPLVLSNRLNIKLRDFMIQENLIEHKEYEFVKLRLLKQADYTEESCRRKWHQVRPKGDDFREYNVALKQAMENWLKTSGTPETFEGIKELILRDRIYQEVSEELGQHLLMLPLKDSDTTLEAIDKFKAAHCGKKISKRQNENMEQIYVASAVTPKYKEIQCWTCGQKGHTSRWCQSASRRTERTGPDRGYIVNERQQDRDQGTSQKETQRVNQTERYQTIGRNNHQGKSNYR